MKVFITIISLLVLSMSAFAADMKDWYAFKRLPYEKQVLFVEKLQQLSINIEETQSKLMTYKISAAERSKLQEKLNQLRLLLSNILISEAQAEERDFGKTCIFAGWLGDKSYNSNQNPVCKISEVKAKSNNYSSSYKVKNASGAEIKAFSKCDVSLKQIPCHPMLFGTKPSGEMFCVDTSSSGSSYKKASLKCRELSKAANNYPQIIANLLSSPTEFLEVADAVNKMCLCDVDGKQIVNDYRDVILKDTTCRSLVLQLKELLAEVKDEDREKYCSEVYNSTQFGGLKIVAPLVDKFSEDADFLKLRTEVCAGTVITTGGDNTTTTTTNNGDDGDNTTTTTGGNTETNDDGSKTQVSFVLEIVLPEDNDKVSYKIKEANCNGEKDLTKIKDCKLSYKIKVDEKDVVTEVKTLGDVMVFEKKDKEYPVEFTFINSKQEKATDTKTIPVKGTTTPENTSGLELELSEPEIEATGDSATIKVTAIKCGTMTKVDDATDDKCMITWYTKSEPKKEETEEETKSEDKEEDKEENKEKTEEENKTDPDKGDKLDSGGFALTQNLLDVEQTITAVLTYGEGGPSISKTKTVAAKKVEDKDEDDKDDKEEEKKEEPANTGTIPQIPGPTPPQVIQDFPSLIMPGVF